VDDITRGYLLGVLASLSQADSILPKIAIRPDHPLLGGKIIGNNPFNNATSCPFMAKSNQHLNGGNTWIKFTTFSGYFLFFSASMRLCILNTEFGQAA